MWQENTASDILYVCDPKHPKYLLVFESTMPLPIFLRQCSHTRILYPLKTLARVHILVNSK